MNSISHGQVNIRLGLTYARRYHREIPLELPIDV